ncbi:centromere protein O [Paramormyrops kingsleyae]|uniref:Centromere protein O n=1 Tax=Paramormyrops kingsleyae TaxID=1676925 RepID=A0A3B3TD69_9TELE|nr:centromere protein O [Paramormyrops kingsleyae]XP_023694898.1 centromere protein O [Paramormyrops kingsleyae]
MEEARAFLKEGVLRHLSMLEEESVLLATRQKEALQQQTRVEELRSKLEKLRAQRDQLRAKVKTTVSLQQLTSVVDQENVEPQEESREESLQLFQLKARLTQVKDLLRAHHLIGGYDVVETRRGKGVCFSLATAFEGRYLETYNLEVDLARTIRICRHNVPPFIPLEKLAQQNLQEDIKAFLVTLSQHLNAFAGRQEQVRLVKELLQGSVLVMETNSLYSIVVLMCTVPGQKETEVLLTLEYGDPTQYLPTRVTFESEDKTLLESPQWKESQSLLQQTPVHTALLAWKKERRIC